MPERTITSDPLAGKKIDVKVSTHYSTTVEFAGGAVATLVMSFDSHRLATLPRIALFGTEGTLQIPDPNNFAGDNLLFRDDEPAELKVTCDHFATRSRGSGVADMAYTILKPERAFRANGEMALHVLESWSPRIDPPGKDER